MIGRIVRALRREGVGFFIAKVALLLQRLAGYRAVLFFSHYSWASFRGTRPRR